MIRHGGGCAQETLCSFSPRERSRKGKAYERGMTERRRRIGNNDTVVIYRMNDAPLKVLTRQTGRLPFLVNFCLFWHAAKQNVL